VKTYKLGISLAFMEEISEDSNLSAFGDAVVNFLYSVAKSRVQGRYTGKKVSNVALSEALTRSKIKPPRRSDKKMRGDFVEALIGKGYIEKTFDINDAVDMLSEKLKGKDLNDPIEENKAIAEAFSYFIDHYF